MASPVEQFQVQPLIGGDSAVAFTNASLWMVIAAVTATVFLVASMRGRALVPTRMQSLAEVFYDLIANMTVGHVLLKVIAGFVPALGIAGLLPFAFLVPLSMLELFIAVLQAYIFTILTCVYLNDALHLH